MCVKMGGLFWIKVFNFRLQKYENNLSTLKMELFFR